MRHEGKAGADGKSSTHHKRRTPFLLVTASDRTPLLHLLPSGHQHIACHLLTG